MKLPTILSGLAALAALASADRRTATIYIQPILSHHQQSAPVPLATLEYDAGGKDLNTAASTEGDADSSSEIKILSYEAPELPPDASLVRVGVWDGSSSSSSSIAGGGGRWISSTTLASAENFAKGYAPVLAVTISPSISASTSSSKNSKGAGGGGGGGGGDILGVAIKGVAVDAGYTRDFGPKAVLVRTEPGRQVDLNRPVVLGPEGKTVEAEPEKSLLQKYWWLIAVVVLLTMTGGGGEGGK